MTTTVIDPDVAALREATTDAIAAERLRALLTGRLAPVVTDVVRRRMRDSRDRQEIDDLVHDALLQLLVKLRRVRTSPEEPPILDAAAYAAVVADRVCSAHLRRKAPERSRLKNRVRYVLTRDARFRIEEQARETWSCRLAAWPAGPAPSGLERLQALRAGDRASASFVAGRDDPRRLALAVLIERVLRFAGGPVDLDDLVSAAAMLLGITDAPAEPDPTDPDRSESWWEATPDPSRPLPERLSDRAFLAALWAEVQTLPPRQRTALLLNLRDGGGQDVTSLLPLAGIATFGEIARCLGLAEDALAGLWPRLPLDDLTIAARLGLERQQVINLRKSARDRLARRMRRWRV